MQPRVKALLIVLFIVAAVIAIRWVSSDPSPTQGEESASTTRFTSPRFVGYHKGVRQWALEADAIEELQEENGQRVVHLTRVHDGVLYRDGEATMRFEAAEGVWHEQSSDLTLEGGVVFVNSDGMRFTTERVHWNADKEHLTSTTQVHITYKDQEFVADRLFADVKGDRYEFTGNVVWKSDAGALVRARTAVYSDERGTLEFRDLEGPAQLVFGAE